MVKINQQVEHKEDDKRNNAQLHDTELININDKSEAYKPINGQKCLGLSHPHYSWNY